jgi:hypothetical protein
MKRPPPRGTGAKYWRRRIATRFEKMAVSFLAMFKLAIIQRYLKLAFSDRA